jgi:hypothetical protein
LWRIFTRGEVRWFVLAGGFGVDDEYRDGTAVQYVVTDTA